MSNEPTLMIPLELVYEILDSAAEHFSSASAAEDLLMEFVADVCKCGQQHKYEEVPEHLRDLANTSIDASRSTVTMIRKGVESIVIQLMDQANEH